MAAKTYRLGAGNDGNFGALFEADQTAASRADGWTVAKIAATNQSDFDAGTKQASTTFAVSAKPASFLTGATANALKTPTALTGTFANAAWTLTFAVRATVVSAQAGRVRMRVFKSVNADGSGATELTSSTQVGTTSSVLSTTADVTSTVTWNPGATITLNNEYLFFVLAWEITTASGSNTADVVPRTGQAAAGTRIVTPNIALTFFGVTATSFTFGQIISGRRTTFASGLKYPGKILADGAVMYWRLGEPSGTVAVDATGKLNGTYSAATLAQPGAIAGDADTSVLFSPVGAEMRTPADARHSTLNPWSLEAWVYMTSYPSPEQAIATHGYASTPLPMVLGTESGTALPFAGFYTPAGGWKRAVAPSVLPLNTWSHMVGTYDGTTIRLYVNGVLAGSAGATGWSGQTGVDFRVGRKWDANGQFPGQIDEVSIWGATLTPTQVLDHYNLGISPPAGAVIVPVTFGAITAGQITIPPPGFASDTFTDTDGTLLASHVPESGAWFAHPAVPAAGEIRSNQMRASANATWLYTNRLVPPSNDYSVKAQVIQSTAASVQQYAGVAARMSPSAVTLYSFRFLYGTSGGPGGWELAKFVNGAFTSLQSDLGQTLAPGTYQIELKVEGTTITTYINGVQKFQVTDTAIASGRAGIIGLGQAPIGQGLTLDNFSVAAISQTVFGATSASFNFGATTQAQRKALGATTSSYAFSSTTQGVRKTFATTVSPYVFSKAVQGIRKTFGVTATPVAFGAVTQAQRKTFSTIAAPFSFGAVTQGIKFSPPKLGATAAAFTFGAVTQGRRKTFSSTATPVTFTKAVVAQRKTFSSTAAPFSFAAVTQSSKKTFGQIAVPVQFVAVTAGVKAAGLKFGSVSAVFSFGAATQAQRKTFSTTAAPFAFSAVTQAKRRTTGVVLVPLTLGAVTQSRKQFAKTATAIIFGEVTQGKKKTYGVVARPIIVDIVTQGIGFTGAKNWFGATATAITFGEVTAGKKQTFASLAMPLLLGEVTQARRKTFGSLSTAFVLVEVTAAQRKTFGKVFLPETVSFYVAAVKPGEVYGSLSFPILVVVSVAGSVFPLNFLGEIPAGEILFWDEDGTLVLASNEGDFAGGVDDGSISDGSPGLITRGRTGGIA